MSHFHGPQRRLTEHTPPGKPAQKLPEDATVHVNASTADLYQVIAARAGTSVHRLRITKGSDGSLVPNAKSVSVHSTGLREQSTVYVKDLGESHPTVLSVMFYATDHQLVQVPS